MVCDVLVKTCEVKDKSMAAIFFGSDKMLDNVSSSSWEVVSIISFANSLSISLLIMSVSSEEKLTMEGATGKGWASNSMVAPWQLSKFPCRMLAPANYPQSWRGRRLEKCHISPRGRF